MNSVLLLYNTGKDDWLEDTSATNYSTYMSSNNKEMDDELLKHISQEDIMSFTQKSLSNLDNMLKQLLEITTEKKTGYHTNWY